MKIVILMEDTRGEQDVYAEHGLSLYIETKHHKILADTGASDRTWENAGALGVDLTDVDTVFLTTSLEYAYLSSTTVKEVASFNGDISKFLPPFVAEEV